MKRDETTYSVGELAELGGVTRRTVRYYVQEGLLSAPTGVGRGRHYRREHLDQLLKLRAMQERGLTLDEIRQSLTGSERARGMVAAEAVPAGSLPRMVPRASWTRLEIAPGLELNVSSDRRLPPPGKLAEITAAIRELFR